MGTEISIPEELASLFDHLKLVCHATPGWQSKKSY